MKRRKIIGLLMAGAMVFGTLTACGNTASQGGESTDGAEQAAQTANHTARQHVAGVMHPHIQPGQAHGRG